MKNKSQFPKAALTLLSLFLLFVPSTHPQAAGNPQQPVRCTVTGQVKNYLPMYRSVFTITLFRDGKATLLKTRVVGSRYTIRNVPDGTYEVRGSGWYQPRNQIIVAVGDDREITCTNGTANSVNFQINSGEGE